MSRPRAALLRSLGLLACGGLLIASAPAPARARAAFSCGGFALLGGAQLLCSHTDPTATPQTCTFSWALTALNGDPRVDQGSFLLEPGTVNATVYQAGGVSGALSPPIVLCQGHRSR